MNFFLQRYSRAHVCVPLQVARQRLCLQRVGGCQIRCAWGRLGLLWLGRCRPYVYAATHGLCFTGGSMSHATFVLRAAVGPRRGAALGVGVGYFPAHGSELPCAPVVGFTSQTWAN